MRIISGSLKGRKINPPANSKARPTTDFAKEGLFSALEARMDFHQAVVFDLFCGTGNIGLECLSRGAEHVYGIDISTVSQHFLNGIIRDWQLTERYTFIRADVWRILKNLTVKADLIFADPPFTLKDYTAIPMAVQEHALLNPGGLLIVEHPKTVDLSHLPNFDHEKTYGSIHFSFFQQASL